MNCETGVWEEDEDRSFSNVSNDRTFCTRCSCDQKESRVSYIPYCQNEGCLEGWYAHELKARDVHIKEEEEAEKKKAEYEEFLKTQSCKCCGVAGVEGYCDNCEEDLRYCDMDEDDLRENYYEKEIKRLKERITKLRTTVKHSETDEYKEFREKERKEREMVRSVRGRGLRPGFRW